MQRVKNFLTDNKLSFLIGFVLILLIMVTVYMTYGAFTFKDTKNLINGEVGYFSNSDISISYMVENRDENGIGTGIYTAFWVAPNSDYEYNASKSSCSNGASFTKETGDNFVVTSSGKTSCDFYYDAKDLEMDADIKIIVYKKDKGSDTYSLGSYFSTTGLYYEGYTLNTEKTYCENGANVSFDEEIQKIFVETSSKTECKVYFDQTRSAITETSTNPDICSGDNTFKEGTFQYNIIENGGGVNCEEPNFATVATTNEGIFQTTDVYGPTYYFRGAVEDNWVKFAGFYWRIIRINGDGSVKILYSGDTAPTEATKVVHSTNAQLSTTVAFNTTRTAPEYVGYTYELGSLNNPSVKGSGDSTIKGAIETWYETNIENQGFSSYIEDTAYCADRTSYSDTAGTSVNSSYNTAYQYFPFYVDLQTNKTPTLLCNDKKDYYTKEDTEIGNAALKYPVSLITANEVAYAGGLRGSGNSNYYLYTGSSYWTLSPYCFTSSRAYVGYVYSSGLLSGTYVNNTYGGRPAVSLKSVILTSGNGSWATPYEVKIN